MQLDSKSKLEKVIGKDPRVPVLANPYLVIHEGVGYLLVSTGYNAVKIPVQVSEQDIAGPVPIDALKELRKVKGGDLRCEEQYCILPNGSAYPRPVHAAYPDIEQLFVDAGVGIVEVSLNVKSLYEIGLALGTDVVKLRLQVDGEDETLSFVGQTIGVEPHPSEPCIDGSRAALLPYKVAQV